MLTCQRTVLTTSNHFDAWSPRKAAASATKVWTLLLEGPTKKGKPEGPSSLKVVRWVDPGVGGEPPSSQFKYTCSDIYLTFYILLHRESLELVATSAPLVR